MSDYEKFTVIKLRDELVKRGLPKTGLKAALVQRLQEADAQVRSVESPPFETTERQLSGNDDKRDSLNAETLASASTQISHEGLQGKEEPAVNDATLVPESARVPEANTIKKDSDEATNDGVPDFQVTEKRNEEEGGGIAQGPPLGKDVDKGRDTAIKTPTEDLTKPLEEDHLVQQAASPEPTQDPTRSPTGIEEPVEDSRKRKRRSQTPPPSSLETQKRLKADSGRPHVALPEDSPSSGNNVGNESEFSKVIKTPSAQDHDKSINGGFQVQAQVPDDVGVTQRSEGDENITSTAPIYNGTSDTDQAPTSEPNVTAVGQVGSTASQPKPSPSDTRFKNLFQAPLKSDSATQQPTDPITEDRVVSPALHPPTSALYIRELMRPLKPEGIREHLAVLATPPDIPTNSNIITDFFLDPIRTHCFVGFTSVSAASRVRSGLHDRIWPNERDRRPLFVDFIPEEKLRQWIDVEQGGPSDRRVSQKRWEVVYKEENDDVKAHLQEIGSQHSGHAAIKTSKPSVGQGVQGAPSGPRLRESVSESQAAQSQTESGQGFKALDDLFKSTAAKPKLYYQPASKDKAEKRLDKLAAGRGGGRGDEMRRYTFEDDIVVDKAPEFGNRRGGHGGRGGYAGSVRGRGAGYLADDYRGRGDSWRNRRSGY